MAKKKTAPKKASAKTAARDERIVLRTGEALVEAEPAWSAAGAIRKAMRHEPTIGWLLEN
jgi:hypothetical protein